MDKNTYLTRKEQRIFAVIGRKDVISHEEVSGLFPQERALNMTLHGLMRKGYLRKLRRGLYAIAPGGSLSMSDPFHVACRLYGGYIGLSSALKLHGLTEYEAFTVFVVTSSKSGERRIGSYIIRAVNFGRRATGHELMGNVYVSTLEKTFFDCFYRPGLVGYGMITKALRQAEPDWKAFLGYFRRFASASLCQRTGYVLDCMIKGTGMKIPEDVMAYFRERVGNNTRLLPSSRKAGTYSREWKVMDNVGRDKFLSWWYDG